MLERVINLALVMLLMIPCWLTLKDYVRGVIRAELLERVINLALVMLLTAGISWLAGDAVGCQGYAGLGTQAEATGFFKAGKPLFWARTLTPY